jgi:hypothetical protein
MTLLDGDEVGRYLQEIEVRNESKKRGETVVFILKYCKRQMRSESLLR